jgi:20S proteasome subunit beta 2
VDLCIINKDGTEYLRNYEYLQAKTYSRVHPVVYGPGTTPIVKERITHLVNVKTDVVAMEIEA